MGSQGEWVVGLLVSLKHCTGTLAFGLYALLYIFDVRNVWEQYGVSYFSYLFVFSQVVAISHTHTTWTHPMASNLEVG